MNQCFDDGPSLMTVPTHSSHDNGESERDAEEITDLNLVVEVRWDGVEAGVGAVRLPLPVRPLALARRGALWEGGFKSTHSKLVTYLVCD